jgi:RNA polymerase sigma-70 factor, ECF subfamily
MSVPPDSGVRINEEEFIRLLGLNQGRVFSFIATLLPDWTEAEEVLARTTVVLWKKADQFDADKDFVRWACGIAYRQTLAYFRERKRSHVTLSVDVLERIAEQRLDCDSLMEERRQALHVCLDKLPESDRRIIDAYYGCTKKTAAEVAAELGRPANTVLKALVRIRRALHRCIDRRVGAGHGCTPLDRGIGGEAS